MPIYERFIGKHRDDFKSMDDIRENIRFIYDENFNFAYDVIDVLAKEQPNKTALVWLGADGREKIFTFADVARESDRAANYFTSLGIKKGDSVLLILRRHYLFWFCIMGLHKIGAITVQATDMLMAKDYIYRCNKAEIKAVVMTDHGDCTKYYDEGADKCVTVKHKLVIGHKDAGEGWRDFEAEFEATSADGWVRPTGDDAVKCTDIMLYSFSSGTTSYPKMVAHDFRYPLGHIMTGVFWHRVVDGGLHFTVSDTGWLKSLWGKMYGQWFGESAIMVFDFDKFNGADILAVIEKYKVTTFCVPPTMYRFILQNDVTKYDLSSIVHCCTAGEALNPEIFNTWKESTGLEIYEGFGQTETTVAIGTFYPYMKPMLGAIGISAPHIDVHIVDLDGDDCPVGQVGEICIKTEYETRPVGICHSYNRSREDTEGVYYGGYFHTGDTAYKDELGYIHYVGRNDDIIKSSGYRIGPFEIESVLIEHPSVLEVAVTGIPDPVRGFNVKATIVLQKGYVGSSELVKELQDYVKKNTAPYKYPRVIEFVEALPKTASGKIRRTAIRQKDMEEYLKKQQQNG